MFKQTSGNELFYGQKGTETKSTCCIFLLLFLQFIADMMIKSQATNWF